MPSAMADPSGGVALSIDVALNYVAQRDSQILLAIEPLFGPVVTIDAEQLTVNGRLLDPAPISANGRARYRWLDAPAGPLRIAYHGALRVDRPAVDVATLPATPLTLLPPDVAPFVLPSRYCEPQRFGHAVADAFGIDPSQPADGSTIIAMRDWIREHIAYEPGSSSETTAIDTYVSRTGVCRDFTHLMIAFARAVHVPARFVAAYAWQLDPPDFHAVAEVFLDGDWHLIDATGLAPERPLVRIARTRDAIDASFMTIFGEATMHSQTVRVSGSPLD